MDRRYTLDEEKGDITMGSDRVTYNIIPTNMYSMVPQINVPFRWLVFIYIP